MGIAQTKQKIDIEAIRALVAADFLAVNELIQNSLHSNVSLISSIGEHITQSGGKRLRPLLVLLIAHLLGYKGHAHITAATIIEFIHTATLLHDDVVDNSMMRRGRQTANAIWDNQASVLVGDFVYSRAFQLMTGLNNIRIMQVLADTTNLIAEGEVLQLMNRNNPDATEADYLKIIGYKTAQLFAAATQVGAIVANANPMVEEKMLQYGLHLGMAFQLIDDMMDYQGSAEAMGKNMGDDLAEGKPTLPLIHVLRFGNEEQRAIVKEAILKGGIEKIADIKLAIENTNTFVYIQSLAAEQAKLAIDQIQALADNPFREALIQLANFTIDRTS